MLLLRVAFSSRHEVNYKELDSLIHCSLYEWRETREPGGNYHEHMENMQNLDGLKMSTLTRF